MLTEHEITGAIRAQQVSRHFTNRVRYYLAWIENDSDDQIHAGKYKERAVLCQKEAARYARSARLLMGIEEPNGGVLWLAFN